MKIFSFALVMAGLAFLLWVGVRLPEYSKTCRPGVMPPLLRAILRDDLQWAARLLENGEDPNRGRAPFGNPFPLDTALERGNVRMIVLLESYGARQRDDFRVRLDH